MMAPPGYPKTKSTPSARRHCRTMSAPLSIHDLRLGLLRGPGLLHILLQPRHHAAQLGAHCFDRVLLLLLAQSGEIASAVLVLLDPLLGKRAILNSRQNFFHGSARCLPHDLFTTGEVTVLGSVGNGVAHTAQPTLVDQVDNQLHLVQALEIGDLGLIAGLDQSFESFLDEGRQPAAEHGLFAEKITLGFFLEGGLQNPGAGRTDAVRVTQRVFVGASAGVLMHGDQRWNTAAFRIYAAQQVTWTFGRNHHYINVFRRDDRLKMNAEAMGDPENLAGMEKWLDCRLVHLGLGLVWREDLDPVGELRGFGGRDDRHPVSLRLLRARPLGIEPHNHLVAAIAQVLGLGMALASVTEDGDGFALEGGGAGIMRIENGGHGCLLYGAGDLSPLFTLAYLT